jgi:hypothetical protein
MSITQGAQYLNNWSAILILGAFAAGAPVGIFNAAARTATFLTAVRFAFSGIFSPIISGLHARQDTEEMGRLYKDVSRWIFTGAFVLFLVIVVFAPQVMSVFGASFGQGVTALVIVAVAQLYSSSVGPAPRMLAMTGNQNFAMIATSVAAVTGVVVSLILIPRYEILGAAIGMATAIITENTGTMVAVKWRLGFWPFNLAWLKPLVAGAIAAGATYLVSALATLPGGPIPNVMVFGGFLGVLFLALLSSSASPTLTRSSSAPSGTSPSATCPPASAAEARTVDNAPVKVLYVAGLGRSGSTILANTLGQVEGFFSGGELNFIWKHALIENRLCGCGRPARECPFWGPVFDGEFGGQSEDLAREMMRLQYSGARTRHIPLMLTEGGRAKIRARLGKFLDNTGRLYGAIRSVSGSPWSSIPPRSPPTATLWAWSRASTCASCTSSATRGPPPTRGPKRSPSPTAPTASSCTEDPDPERRPLGRLERRHRGPLAPTPRSTSASATRTL